MRRVIVNMKDYIFADAVTQSLQADQQSDFNVILTTQYGGIATISQAM